MQTRQNNCHQFPGGFCQKPPSSAIGANMPKKVTIWEEKSQGLVIITNLLAGAGVLLCPLGRYAIKWRVTRGSVTPKLGHASESVRRAHGMLFHALWRWIRCIAMKRYVCISYKWRDITAILYQIVGQAAFRREGRDVNLKTYAMSIIKTNSRHTVLCLKSVLW